MADTTSSELIPTTASPGQSSMATDCAALAIDAVIVVPVFNEQHTILQVLHAIKRHTDWPILVVDDGSTDGSSALLDEWAATTRAGRVHHLGRNQGKSAALRAAWAILRADHDRGALSDRTLVICLDADGQHDLDYLPALIARTERLDADLVIARREMGYHSAYKRLGNAVMAALGSVCAGQRLHDIESGYRIVRLGPLLHAQQFYAGQRYSESVELTVVLARLGYRVDNAFEVRVPVARTRTRLHDAAAHAVAMCAAWYRVACWRDVPPLFRSLVGATVAALLLLVFAAFLVIVLMHPFYLGNDSAQSYGHVWFIAQSLWSDYSIPLHIPNLENGLAYTFPYALPIWLPAAIVYPLLGDWTVTASMGVGVGVLALGLRRWLPGLASPLLLGAVLLNWQIWNGVLQFQLPTIWAIAFACLAAAEFERERSARGTALAMASIMTHPVIGTAGLLLTLLARIERERRVPWRQAPWLTAAAVLSAPAWWMFATTPSMGVTTSWAILTPLQILLQRTSMLWWPWLCQRGWPTAMRMQAPLLLIGSVLLVWNVLDSNPQNLLWRSLPRFPDYLAAGKIDLAARYRVLTMSNQEDGLVQLMKAGAILTHEFFDESIARRSFKNTEEYRCFLARTGTDRVLVQSEWVRRGTTNEMQLLDALVRDGQAARTFHGADGSIEYTIQSGSRAACG